MRIWAKTISAPNSVDYPGALLLCLIGAYVTTGGLFGMWMLIFAILGYFMRLYGFSIVAFIIGYVLTPELEAKLTQSILITRGDPTKVLEHPIALILLALSVVSVIYLGPKRSRPQKA